MKTVKIAAGTKLFRHGKPSTEEYVWFTPTYNIALKYGQLKTFKLGMKNSEIIKNIITKSYPRNLTLLNISNKNTMKYLLNQLKPGINLLQNNYILYNGNKVNRKTNYNKDVIIANLIKGLKNKLNVNGFYNRGGKRLNTEIVVFDSNMPRRLGARRVRNVVKKNPNSFNEWKMKRSSPPPPQSVSENRNSLGRLKPPPLPPPAASATKRKTSPRVVKRKPSSQPLKRKRLLAFSNENNKNENQ